MQVCGSDGPVVLFGVVLAEVVGIIFFAALVVHKELALVYPIADLIEPHVHRFASFLLHFVVDDATGSAVVSLDGSWGLGMAKFL